MEHPEMPPHEEIERSPLEKEIGAPDITRDDLVEPPEDTEMDDDEAVNDDPEEDELI
jgi:hypothetical protein